MSAKRLVQAGIVAAVALPLSAALAPASLARDFEHPASHDSSQQFSSGSVQRQDTPTDPDYDEAEPDTLNKRTSTNLFDERFDLFGFPSQLTPSAIYKDGPNAGKPMVAGFNAAGAWKLERGRPDVVIAVLDTGIKWSRQGLRDQVHLNTRELPLPQRADGTTSPTYDLNGNGRVDVDDYAQDPRVKAHMPAGQTQPTAEDLIHSFSDRVDQDHNGFVDDIAGWDFFDDDNDPFDAASYFAAENHGSGRQQEAAEQGNEGQGSLGICPHCQLMPIRTWDTFVSDGNTFAMGIDYAADNGARVIEGSNGSLYHSAFAELSSQYAYEHGAVQVFSGDDLNTGNHNFPATYNHAMYIQGTVPDTVGLGQNADPLVPFFAALHIPLGTQVPVQTFFRGANTTQYGAKSSVALEGSTGSENTGKSSGAAGLVVSAALDKGIVPTPDETREIIEQTAEDVTAANTIGTGNPDAAQPGWDVHFGYGRVNLGAAVALAQSGKLPPEVAIDAPDWFAPLRGASVRITGRARARFANGGAFHWKLQWGPGIAPTTWSTVREGDSTGVVSDFGSIDLAQVRAAVARTPAPNSSNDPGMPTFASGEPNPYQQQFAVRVVATGAGIPTAGMDRHVFTALDDASLLPGYPKRLGTGGEGPVRYADVNGDNVQELLVPGQDGVLRAYEPNGRELRGWPVRTRTLRQAADHPRAPAIRALPPAREPLRAPVVADLDGDGQLEVVAAAGTHIYAWEPDGRLRRGFPLSINPAFCRAADESQPLHHRKCGFLASPALGRLQGRTGPLDIVAAALDGHLYAFDPRGRRLAGYPVDLSDPGVAAKDRMLAESINEPAIADLNGDGRDDVVVASNESYGAQSSPNDVSAGFEQGLADILGSAVGGSSRLYAIDGATGKFMRGWPIKLNGAIQNVLPLIGPGHDAAVVRLGGTTVLVVSTTGGSLAEYTTDGKLIRTMRQSQFGSASDTTDRSVLINLFEYASIGDVLGNGKPAVVKYGLSVGQLANLALTGQNFPYNHAIGAYDAASGDTLPAWPTVTDDYQFLSQSNVVKLNGGRANQVLAGTGLGELHAYDGTTGHDISGFPKQTGGWLYSPAALSDSGSIADITREGFLFAWRQAGAPACQTQWPTYRHDLHSTGNYDADGTAPAAPRPLRLRHLRGQRYRLTFRSPGDDGFCGRARSYRGVMTTSAHIAVAGQRRVGLGAVAPGGSTVTRDVTLRTKRGTLAVMAVDDAGNVGPAVTVRFGRLPARARRVRRPVRRVRLTG